MTLITIDSATIDDAVVEVAISWAGAPSGASASLYLNSDFTRTAKFVPLPSTAGTATLVDFEPPQNTELTYVAFLHDSTGFIVAFGDPETVVGVVDVGADLLTSTVAPSTRATVMLSGVLTQKYAADPQIVRVVGRPAPVVVSSRRKAWTSDLEVVTDTLDAATALDETVSGGEPLCLRPRYADTHGLKAVEYLAVGDLKKARVSALATIPDRRYSLPVFKIAPPPYLHEPIAPPDACTLPGALTFPGTTTFPGCSGDAGGTYPSTSTYPGFSTFPTSGVTGGTYPGDYPGSDTYPGGL